jgi:hypothetical protein
MDLGKRNNTKVLGKFDGFPVGINTPSFVERFRSYDLCKLWGASEINFWTEQDTWINLKFEPTFNGKLKEP